MKTRIAVGCVFLTLFLVIGAAASPQVDPAKATDIYRLIELTGSKDIALNLMAQMVESLKPWLESSWEKSYPSLPDERSRQLSDIFFERWKQKFMTRAAAEMLEPIIPIYDKYLTHEEIKGLLQFYEAPLGRRLIQVLPRIVQESSAAGSQLGKKLSGGIAPELIREMEEEYPELKISNIETAIIAALRVLNSACTVYVGTYYGRGFPKSLAVLGPPPQGPPSADSADLIAPDLAGGTKHGYKFTYVARDLNGNGMIESYTINADLIASGRTGQRSFFTDETGVIRADSEGRAGPHSPVTATQLVSESPQRNLLHVAARRGDIATVKALLTNKEIVNAKNIGEWTALMEAAGGGHTAIVQALLDAGADINVKDNEGGLTALIVAAALGQTDVVKVLLDAGADVNARDAVGETALRKAQESEQTKVVEILLLKKTSRLRKSIEENPDDAAARMELGDTLYLQGEPDAAIQEYSAVIAMGSAEPSQTGQANFKIGIAYEGMGREKDALDSYHEALSQYLAAIHLKPDEPLAHDGIGHVYYQKGDFKAAEAAFREALRLRPDLHEARTSLAEVLLEMKKRDQALQVLRDGLRLDRSAFVAEFAPDMFPEERKELERTNEEAAAHLCLGILFTRRNEQDRDLEEFQQAVRLDPNFALAHAMVGIAYSEKRKVELEEEALKALENAVRLNPELGTAHFSSAKKLRWYLDSFEAKERAVQAAIEAEIEFAKVHKAVKASNWQDATSIATLAEILYQMDAVDGAIETIQKAISLEPDSEYYKEQLEKFERAKQTSERR